MKIELGYITKNNLKIKSFVLQSPYLESKVKDRYFFR